MRACSMLGVVCKDCKVFLPERCQKKICAVGVQAMLTWTSMALPIRILKPNSMRSLISASAPGEAASTDCLGVKPTVWVAGALSTERMLLLLWRVGFMPPCLEPAEAPSPGPDLLPPLNEFMPCQGERTAR